MSEGLYRWIERSRDVDASRTEDLLLEVSIDLSHVAHLVGAEEAGWRCKAAKSAMAQVPCPTASPWGHSIRSWQIHAAAASLLVRQL